MKKQSQDKQKKFETYALEYFQKKHKKDISKEFFVNFMTKGEVSTKLFSKAFKSRIPKIKSVGIVTSLHNVWTSKQYFEKPEKKKIIRSNNKPYTADSYRLNLNFFFDYSKTEGFEFTLLEKKFLEELFKFKNFREAVYNYQGSLLEALKSILKRFFVLEYSEMSVRNDFQSRLIEEERKKKFGLLTKERWSSVNEERIREEQNKKTDWYKLDMQELTTKFRDLFELKKESLVKNMIHNSPEALRSIDDNEIKKDVISYIDFTKRYIKDKREPEIISSLSL